MGRLYLEQVAPRRETRVSAPGSRAMIRSYCSQVWQQAYLWNRIERAVRVSEFTFPGDPMRLDYGYRRNGVRGFVHTLERLARAGRLQAAGLYWLMPPMASPGELGSRLNSLR